MDSYKWQIQLQFADIEYQQIADFVRLVNSELLQAVERSLAQAGDSRTTIAVSSGGVDSNERIIAFRKTYQIKEVPRKFSDVSYSTAEEAIEAMRACRDRATTNKESFVLLKEGGLYYVARDGWASCEFDSEIEAEDALQAFDDASAFQIIPVMVVESSTSGAE